jgi:sugar lactone lactonase YvrE
MKKVIYWGVGLLSSIVIFFVVFPAPIDPEAYSPDKAPELTGVLSSNISLIDAELLALGKIHGPEEVAMDVKGRTYAGTQDGKIIRLLPNGMVETFADTQGRPLGIQFDINNNLIVCDAYKGPLSIDPEGKITELTTSAADIPFKLTDALDISSDGTIYFTDASHKYDQKSYLYDLLESRPYGRFLAYDPSTGHTKVLLKDLYFANGVCRLVPTRGLCID